jgi:hypothetical protein
MTQFVVSEARLTKKLGLPRKVVREQRDYALLKGTDWQEEGGEVRLTRAGTMALMESLGLFGVDADASEQAALAAPVLAEASVGGEQAVIGDRLSVVGAEGPASLETTPGRGPAIPEGDVGADAQGESKALALAVLEVDARTRNKRIVMAWVNDPAPRAELVRVQVRDSKNFVAGMRIECRHVEEDLWELVGRCPRSRRDDPMGVEE